MSLSLSRNHWIPCLGLVMLALAQLACTLVDGYIYHVNVVDYCANEDTIPLGSVRYGGAAACYRELQAQCPNSSLSTSPDACVLEQIDPPEPAAFDCTGFRITSPNGMFPNPEAFQPITWTLPTDEVHHYNVAFTTGASGFERGAYASGGDRTTTYIPTNADTIFYPGHPSEMIGDVFVVTITAYVGEYAVCEDTVTIRRYVPPTATPTPVPTDIPFTPTIDCSGFRLTSPLDGLANGVNTIYWDALRDGQGLEIAQGYALTVSDGSTTLASLSTAAGTTNATVDVSSTTGGDGGVLTVTVEALVNGRAVCSSAVALPRSAYVPPGGEPPPVGTPGV